MPTLDDVARRAGVARVTASRVINGTYAHKVSAQTRERVLRAVAELNYSSSIPARALRNRRTMQFGLLIHDLAVSFMPEVVQGLQDVATEMEYGCLIYLYHDDPQQEERSWRMLVSRRVDAVVWIPHAHATKQTLVYASSLPTVQLLYQTTNVAAPAVLIDQEQGGYLAAQHLLALGHHRLAYCMVDHPHWHQRVAGFRRALVAQGLATESGQVITVPDNSWEQGYETAQALIAQKPRPTAIIAASDAAAWGTLRAAQQAGLNVPHDLAIVGFGNLALSEQVEVPLTTISHPKRAVGQHAMHVLRSLLDGQQVSNVVLPVRLVERASTNMSGSVPRKRNRFEEDY